jgi:hypothetical protein
MGFRQFDELAGGTVRDIPPMLGEELGAIAARVPDPGLRAIELALAVEEAYGVTLPPRALEPAEDAVAHVLDALAARDEA